VGVNDIFVKSKPDHGFGFPLSGIGTPALRIRIVLLLSVTGLFPEATITPRLVIVTINNRIEAMIIPVIVASV
jgi:hypothetical protein